VGWHGPIVAQSSSRALISLLVGTSGSIRRPDAPPRRVCLPSTLGHGYRPSGDGDPSPRQPLTSERRQGQRCPRRASPPW
jgi:hypothetical protein